MKRTRRILHVIIVILLVFQLLAYLGTMSKESTKAEGVNLVAYYIGFNLPVIICLILFLVSRYLKAKISKKETTDLIDSIGKD